MSRRMAAADVLAEKASGDPLVMVTAYDFPTARIVDAAGVDIILVGDTLSEVVLGHPDTLHVTVDQMVHHVAAVANAEPRALVVGDLPWMSYHVSPHDAVRSAAELIRAGADVVKLEGGRKRTDAIRAILDAEIPVMGHLGLTPQSIRAVGGYKLQARDEEGARSVIEDAKAVAEAGCFAVVLECVPTVVADHITRTVPIPTIGIGAGPHCDGQVLVVHDLLGLGDDTEAGPRYVRRYASLAQVATAAVGRYADDVRSGRFPTEEEAYRASPAVARTLELGTEHRRGELG